MSVQARRIACPSCGSYPFSWGPAGPPERRCWSCATIWTPASSVGKQGLPPKGTAHTEDGAGHAPAGPQEATPETGGRLTSATPASFGHHLAVLVPAGLRGISAGVPANPRNLTEVLHVAARVGVRQVWIGPAMAGQLELAPGTHPWLVEALRVGWTDGSPAKGVGRQELAPWMELRHDQYPGTARIELVFPSWDPDGNPFAPASSAGELLTALELFAHHTGLRYRWSPGATGLALMRQVHAGGVELPEVGTPAPIAVEQRGALDSWVRRSWIAELPTAGWLHAWDLNGMYLAAASSAELGFGEPRHQKITDHQVEGHPMLGMAGYWRATVRARRQAIAPPFKVDGRAHWYTSAGLAYLVELGYKPRATEAWLYPQRRRWLEPWYERLRDARTALLGAEGGPELLALAAVKRVYTAAVGRLAGSWLQAGAATFRPDWRHVVVERARINLDRKLRAAAWAPTAMDEDQVVWQATDQDPSKAAFLLGLEVSTQLGKWKHSGAAEAAAAAAAVAAAGTATSKRLRALLDVLEPSR